MIETVVAATDRKGEERGRQMVVLCMAILTR